MALKDVITLIRSHIQAPMSLKATIMNGFGGIL